MGFFSGNRKVETNFDYLSGFSYHIPGVSGMFALLLWLLVGAFFGNILVAIFSIFLGTEFTLSWGTLIAYILMFIPPMIYARFISSRNAVFDPGVSIDSSNTGKWPLIVWAGIVMVGTFAAGFVMDLVNSAMPPMPEWLENALGSMTTGNFLMNFLSVSIFAPLCEEWLCRGEVLRGLLNCTRTNSDGTVTKGMKPASAIVISAAFFALIHLNPWQAIPAFALGLLFGYVYYKTGSLKLTMLMHFTNNTISLILTRIPAVEDAESWLDIVPGWAYAILFILCAAFLYWMYNRLKEIPLIAPQGNCDQIPANE